MGDKVTFPVLILDHTEADHDHDCGDADHDCDGDDDGSTPSLVLMMITRIHKKHNDDGSTPARIN